MDDPTFDGLTRTIAMITPTRRGTVRLLAGGGLAAALAHFGRAETTAKQKRKKCKAGQTKCGKRCCGKGEACLARKCRPCTVCAKGCRFKTAQAAVDAARPGATIRLCPGTYVGETRIDKNVVLVGAGAGRTRLHGNQVVRVLIVSPGTTVRIQDLTVTGGRAGLDGGGIYNSSRLSLNRVAVMGNTSDSNGGGIHNTSGSQLTLTNSRVADNTAGFSGGGIYNIGTLTSRQGSSVGGNRAGNLGGGIYHATNATGGATVEPGSVRGNTPDQCAGAAVSGC